MKYFFNKSIAQQLAVFAGISITLATMFTGFMSFLITKDSIVKKLKEQDLINLIRLKGEAINHRIKRGKETSYILARDPVIRAWFSGKETDQSLKNYSLAKLKDVRSNYGYSMVFAANVATKNCWIDGEYSYQLSKKFEK